MNDYKKKKECDEAVKGFESTKKSLDKLVDETPEPVKYKQVKKKLFRKVFNNG